MVYCVQIGRAIVRLSKEFETCIDVLVKVTRRHGTDAGASIKCYFL